MQSFEDFQKNLEQSLAESSQKILAEVAQKLERSESAKKARQEQEIARALLR
ncbi:hypothetical protein H6F89_25080 [Cyanobacteria bacterium FACHB-63]|nr:hypothetical protein [Cyanobacteria bacterium FACHB-63]